MTDSEIKKKVKKAVEAFLKETPSLLGEKAKAHEQSISHRIAVYLEPLFSHYNIDCEYNKHLDGSKIIDLETCCHCSSCEEKREKCKDDPRSIRPDIIIHKRRDNTHNIIAIEIKKSASKCNYDFSKLRGLTSTETHQNNYYGYQLGLFLHFSEDEPKYIWFKNGEEMKK